MGKVVFLVSESFFLRFRVECHIRAVGLERMLDKGVEFVCVRERERGVLWEEIFGYLYSRCLVDLFCLLLFGKAGWISAVQRGGERASEQVGFSPIFHTMFAIPYECRTRFPTTESEIMLSNFCENVGFDAESFLKSPWSTSQDGHGMWPGKEPEDASAAEEEEEENGGEAEEILGRGEE